jgi:hypothetical protein
VSRPRRLGLIAALGAVAALAAAGYLALSFEDPLAAAKPTDWVALGKRFHRGPGPCLRYWKAPASDEELREVVDQLVAAGGTCEGLKTGARELVKRGSELGGAEHASSEADELAQVVEEGLPWWGPLALRVQGVDLRKTFADRGHLELAAGEWSKLPAPQQKALDDAWHQKPTAFVLFNVVRLIRAMNVRSTQARLDSLAHLLEAARDTHRSAAAAQAEIEGLPETERRDCWSTPIEIAAVDGGLRLRSLGEDEIPGGVGADADLERVVAWDLEEPAIAAEEPAPAGCGPVPAHVTFDRSEVERFASDMTSPARQARMVPHFENGQVVGFKLFRVPAGSAYTRLGLCDGDVVNVTGVSPMDPSQAVAAFARFQAGQPVELRVLRGGRESTVVTQIR